MEVFALSIARPFLKYEVITLILGTTQAYLVYYSEWVGIIPNLGSIVTIELGRSIADPWVNNLGPRTNYVSSLHPLLSSQCVVGYIRRLWSN